MSSRNPFLLCLVPTVLFAACSHSPPPVDTTGTAKAATEAKADNALKLYSQMRASGNWDLATTLGDELLEKYPGTAAAAQAQQTIGEARAKAARQLETRRLARLWAYNAVAEAGGTQYTAAIGSKQPIDSTDVKK